MAKNLRSRWNYNDLSFRSWVITRPTSGLLAATLNYCSRLTPYNVGRYAGSFITDSAVVEAMGLAVVKSLRPTPVTASFRHRALFHALTAILNSASVTWTIWNMHLVEKSSPDRRLFTVGYVDLTFASSSTLNALKGDLAYSSFGLMGPDPQLGEEWGQAAIWKYGRPMGFLFVPHGDQSAISNRVRTPASSHTDNHRPN